MSLTKRYLEDISVEMGFDGIINQAVMDEAVSRESQEHDHIYEMMRDQLTDSTNQDMYEAGSIQPEDL